MSMMVMLVQPDTGTQASIARGAAMNACIMNPWELYPTAPFSVKQTGAVLLSADR